MNENSEEILIDLLIKQATEGLTETEQQQLDRLEAGSHDNSFAMTTAAISLIDEKADEPMPMHLRANIRASAEKYFDEKEASIAPVREVSVAPKTAGPSFLNWLGWAVAGAACLALVLNIYFTRSQAGDIVKAPTPTPTVETPSLAKKRQELMESAPDITKANWVKGNMKEIASVSGDIVWSDSKQSGYMVLRGFPVNDSSKQQYQLWIFDETQSDKTPIDGGVFDVNENGEVIIPVNAKLRARHPKLFAITMEKPGGVVVSPRDKIAALGKVET